MKSTTENEPASGVLESSSKYRQAAGLCAVLLWCSQPPFALWPLAFVALIPLIWCVENHPRQRTGLLSIYCAAGIYWLITLQGIRHAHVAMYFGWVALSLYLAVYFALFVVSVRRLLLWNVPMCLAVPIAWVGAEWVRNYFITGISAAMLGHTMADVPWMIQIADLGGSYAVSFVVACVSAAIYEVWRHRKFSGVAIATGLLIATLVYGAYRAKQPTTKGSTTFALIQRNEPIEWMQSEQRELEVFEAYTRQSIEATKSASSEVDVIVWPESMYTGGIPLLRPVPTDELAGQIASEQNVLAVDAKIWMEERISAFEFRSGNVQRLVTSQQTRRPDLLVGCGVVKLSPEQTTYSSVVHVNDQSRVADWYGKTHLVMFGEYIPLVKSIPGIKSMVPKGMGLDVGDGPRLFQVGVGERKMIVAPNICIETAVERVTVNQLAALRNGPGLPDAIVTVTNDGWYDDSSIIAHHRRCAQLVAVGCRRPILSSANNGPTFWIDSAGRIIEQMPQGENGAVIATPRRDSRTSLYLRIKDWPASSLGIVFIVTLIVSFRAWRFNDRDRPSMNSQSIWINV